MSHVRVIDRDYRRRAQIAREMLARDLHAEIYEDYAEFRQVMPREGFILCSDAEAPGVLDSMRQDTCELPLLIYSPAPATADVVEAMRLGALDLLEWPFTSQSLDRCLERLATDGKRRLAQIQRRADAKAMVARLSGRETDVLVELAQGGSNKSIGETLGISPRTVEIHRANMMNKLNAESTADAVRIAIYAGLDGMARAAAA